jgi:hypothetical protein
MPAIAMIIWLGVTPAQLQSVHSAQPAATVKPDLIRAEQLQQLDHRARTSERAVELPSSTR